MGRPRGEHAGSTGDYGGTDEIGHALPGFDTAVQIHREDFSPGQAVAVHRDLAHSP